MADVAVQRWWVIPMARLVVRSSLSFEDMHARLESLFDTDDRLIAEYAPSQPPRRPFQGYARMGEVELLERHRDNRRREYVMLVARGRVQETAQGSALTLRFRPSAWTLILLALLCSWLCFLGLPGRDWQAPGLLSASVYVAASLHFWWRFAHAERVLRQAFNG